MTGREHTRYTLSDLFVDITLALHVGMVALLIMNLVWSD